MSTNCNHAGINTGDKEFYFPAIGKGQTKVGPPVVDRFGETGLGPVTVEPAAPGFPALAAWEN